MVTSNIKKKKQATVSAGTCIEEGGDPVPHLEALDPILAELKELESKVKKAPTEEVDDARYVRYVDASEAFFVLFSSVCRALSYEVMLHHTVVLG